MPSENQGRVENARSEGLVYVTTPGKLRALPSEAMGAYLGGLTGRLASLTPLPRILTLVAALVFGGLSLYAWMRLLRALGGR